MNKILCLCIIYSLVGFISGCGGNCNIDEKILLITPYAGMGNKLRVLASAKIMAAVSGRHLVVDWTLLKDEMPGFWSDFFLNPLTTYEQSSLYRQGCSLKSIKNASSDANIKNLGNQNKFDEASPILASIPAMAENIVYFGTSLPFSPDEKYLSSSLYEERKKLFYKNLDPVKEISDEITNFKRSHDFDKYFMVGVHYRAWNTGAPDQHDNLITDLSMRYLPDFITEMKKAMALPLADREQKEVAFFITSDKNEVISRLANEPSFIGRIFYYDKDKSLNRSTIAGQRNDLVDFFLLGETNYIIGTYQSSYSDEAAFFTKQGKKINIGKDAYK